VWYTTYFFLVSCGFFIKNVSPRRWQFYFSFTRCKPESRSASARLRLFITRSQVSTSMFHRFKICRGDTYIPGQNNPLYTSPVAGSIHASVWDVTSTEGLPQDVLPGTVDIVILVFVMSALHPDEWGQAINNIQKVSLDPFRK
jgi:hypothetical protein